MIRQISVAFCAASVTFLAGCASWPMNGPTEVESTQGDDIALYEKIRKETLGWETKASASFMPYVDPKPTQREEGVWLSQINVSLTEPSSPIPASEIVRMLRGFGVNVTSTLPLNSYLYSGYGVDNMNARAAMGVLFTPMGLDYEINEQDRFVTITPLPTQTWKLPVKNRKISYESEASTDSGGGGEESEGGGSGSSSGIATASVSSVDSSSNTESNYEMNSDFWKSLSVELDQILTLRVPKPGQITPDGLEARQSFEFEEVKTGRVSMNPDTGYINIQAPRRKLKEIDKYLTRLTKGFNTRLVFEGKIYLVTQSAEESRGIDLSSFVSFAQNKYGLVVTNNALGGVTVNPPTSSGTLSAATGSGLTQNALGIISRDNLFQVFTAFLESEGSVRTVQEPLISTTPGVPAAFSQTDKTYINNISESSSQNTTGNQISRANTLVPFEFGTTLRINPDYDIDNNRVRAMINLVQVIQSGFVEIDQFVSDGNSSRPITTRVPLDRRIDMSGETLLDDGAMVILGGQRFESSEQADSGFKWLRKSFLGPLFGKEDETKLVSTYYFALSVRAVPMES